jgi:hypothetical protein
MWLGQARFSEIEFFLHEGFFGFIAGFTALALDCVEAQFGGEFAWLGV